MAMFSNQQIQDNYHTVLERVRAASARAGRQPGDVLLLPVSKLHPAIAIEALYELGVRDFGESRVQELLKKRDALPKDIRWHFIGNLQSNKVRQIVEFVHLVHSIHSVSLGEELSKRAIRPIDALVEVNISSESSKSGVNPEDARSLLQQLESMCPNVRIVGLMGMASYEEDPERTRPQFHLLASLFREFRGGSLSELSMGMTNDYEIAIEEGATIVRVGSAIFGERDQ